MENMNAEITELVAMIADHLDDAAKIDSRAHGWKSANKRVRKTTLALEKRLKALRKASIELER
jgi:hypothetical protein